MLTLALLACTPPFPCASDEVLDAAGDCLPAADTPGADSGRDTDADTSADSGPGDSSVPGDDDGDGWTLELGDCDDADAARHPGAAELCDGIDNDCDGGVGTLEEKDDDEDGEPACLDCDDRDPTLFVGDGSCERHEFPLGFMSVEDSADFPRLADLGITYVHAYNFGPWPSSDLATDIAWSQTYLDEADANGLKVLANLNGDTRAEQGAPLDDFRRFVEAVQAYPAVGAWYIADEPEFSVTADSLYEMQSVLDVATPDVRVQVSHCWCTGWWNYWYVGDVRMPDFYGVLNDPIPTDNVKYHPTLTAYMRAYYTESRVDPILQAFNYAVYSDEDPVNYPADSRFPTRDEIRFWAFSDLSLGVGGLWWWSWYRANEHEDGAAWLDSDFRPALDEIRRFVEEVKPASNPVVVAPGPDEITEYTYLAYWPRPSGTYVVATNGSASVRTLELALGETFSSARLVAWDGTSPEVVLDASGATTIEADAYEVFIWRVVD